MEAKKDEIRISTDAMIALVVAEAEAREMAAMPSLQEMNEAFQPSERFQQKMDKLMRSVRNRQRLRRWKKAAKRTALCAAVLLSVFSCMMLPVKAVREAVVTTVLDWQDKFVSVVFDAQGNDGPDLPDTIELSYIPEGFSLQEPVLQDTDCYEITYKGGETYFAVTVMRMEGPQNIGIDNERTGFYQIQFDSHNALWSFSDKGTNTLIWHDDGFVYQVGGTIELNEIIRIAENIKI